MANRRYCAIQLQDIPSSELDDFVSDVFKRKGDHRVNTGYFFVAPEHDDLFLVSGACDVLRDRHGQEYVDQLMGVRRPAGFKEKMNYFFTGNLPKIN